jgi:thymidylate synthase (FAD)
MSNEMKDWMWENRQDMERLIKTIGDSTIMVDEMNGYYIPSKIHNDLSHIKDKLSNILTLHNRGKDRMHVRLKRVTPDPEQEIVEAGRVCYQSESQSEENDKKFIKSLIKSGHDSVLEHASATFNITGVSRAMSHQMVRHRLCSFSQQSQRYVKEDQFDFVTPPAILLMDLPDDSGLNAEDDYTRDMHIIQEMYDKWKARGLKNEDARFVLPNACCTEMEVSANFRQWRWVFHERCDHHAQWEIRKAMNECLMDLYEIAPTVFGDLVEKYEC